ncbi:ankyrin repeat-containing protein [Borealpox virus]|nr:ankyrin repeat-containing protein [Alaskapox virus]
MGCNKLCECILCHLLDEDVTYTKIEPEIGTCKNLSKYIDRRGNNALHCYVSNKCDTDINVIRLLLSCGVERLRRNNEGLTPLGVYSKHRHVKTRIVLLLISSYSNNKNKLKSNINDFDLYSYISSNNIDLRLLKYLIVDKRIRPSKNMNHTINRLGLVDIYVTTPNPRPEILLWLLKSERYSTGYVFRSCMHDRDMCKNPLHYYILSHRESLSKDIIKCLIDNNVSIHGRDKYGGSLPIQYYWSCSNIDIDIVKLLIKDVDTCRVYDDNTQPYIRGVLADYLNRRFRGTPYSVDMEIVNLLIEGRDHIDIMRSITSYDSREYNHYIIDNILTSFGQQDTFIIQSILMNYLHYGDMVSIPIIQCMLDNGATMDTTINDNYPLHEYFTNDNNIVDVDVVRFIVENNGHVAVNHLTNCGRICMHGVITSRFNCGYHNYEYILIDILDILIKHINNIDMVDAENKTLLYYAVDAYNVQLVTRLLEYGASVETPSCSIINSAIRKSSYRRDNNEILVNLLLRYRPALESMIHVFNGDIRYQYPEPLFACIRYALILDDDFPSKVQYDIASHHKELKRYRLDINRMKNVKISGISMFDIFFKRNRYHRLRYAKNPTFLNFTSNIKWYKKELTSIIEETVKNREIIDSIVDDINTDNNLISKLPMEIQREILYYSIE